MSDTLEALRVAVADRYNVLGEVGRGGMAIVYLALERRSGRKVAVKVMNPAVPSPTARARFCREVGLAHSLTHPRIVPVLGAGEAGDLLYYVMPYLEGESLRQRLDREPRLSLEEILPLVDDVVDAVAYAHRQGIVHRDIKPDNILMDDGRPLLADFGVARARAACGLAPLTRAGGIVGTPGYMSPEQAMGRPDVDERADVYGLGSVLYEMLVGEPPTTFFETTADGRIKDAPPQHRARLNRLPRGLERVLARALAKTPADRFLGAREFGRALNVAAHEAERIGGPAWARRVLRLLAPAAAVAILLL